MVRRHKWLLAHFVLLGAVAAFLVYTARGQWFFGDEWDFLLYRGIRGTHKLGLLTPHNEHWSTLPILAWRSLFSFFGLKSYWPYMGLLIGCHLLCVHLLWRLLRRLPGVRPELALAGAAVFGFYGPGWENLLWAFQIGFIGSVAAGLALLVAIDDRGSRRRVAAVAVGAVLSLMISGISVVMVAVAGIAAFLKWGWQKALLVVGPAGVVYVVWLKRYGQTMYEQGDQLHGTLRDAPAYVFGGLAGTIGEALGGHRYVGGILLTALIVFALYKLRFLLRDAPEAVALGVGSALLFGVISQGRGALADPVTSRYLYIAAAMLVPLVVLAITALSARAKVTRALAVIAAIAVAGNGVVILGSHAQGQRRINLSMRGQLIAVLALADSGIRVVSDQPQSPFAPDVRLADLMSLRSRHKLFALTGANARDHAAAQIALQAATMIGEPKDRRLGATVALETSGITVERTRDGCGIVRPPNHILFIRLDPGNAFSATSDTASVVDIYYGFDGGYGGPRRMYLKAGETQSFESDLVGPAAIQLGAGAVRLCGITWDAVKPAG
jgi:hypothetical protein